MNVKYHKCYSDFSTLLLMLLWSSLLKLLQYKLLQYTLQQYQLDPSAHMGASHQGYGLMHAKFVKTFSKLILFQG